MRAMFPVVVGALLATAACAETPLSPTSASSAMPVNGTPALRWDIVAAGCSPAPAPSPLPSAASASMRIEGDGSMLATWPIVSPNDRVLTLYARFLSYQRDWALCSWDTVDQ